LVKRGVLSLNEFINGLFLVVLGLALYYPIKVFTPSANEFLLPLLVVLKSGFVESVKSFTLLIFFKSRKKIETSDAIITGLALSFGFILMSLFDSFFTHSTINYYSLLLYSLSHAAGSVCFALTVNVSKKLSGLGVLLASVAHAGFQITNLVLARFMI